MRYWPVIGTLAATWGAITFFTVGSTWWIGGLAGLIVVWVIVPLIVRVKA